MKLPILMLLCISLLAVSAFALDVEIIPEDATEDDDLGCVLAGLSDEESELFDYYWYVNREFAAVSSELDSPHTEAGDRVMCYVTDSFGSFVGSETITILPAPEEESVEEPENRRPTVEITRPTRDNIFFVDQLVLFSASGSDPDGDRLSYRWNFGDGTGSDFQIVAYRYNNPGVYTASVVVSDGELSATARITVEVIERPAEKEANEDPVAVIVASDRFVGPDDIVVLNALMSYDLDGRIASYEWILRPGAEFAFGGSNDGLITIRFNRNGFHRVDLRVTDNDGATDAEFVLILVSDVFAENEAPVADAGDDIDVFIDEDVDFDGSGSFDDDGTIVSYEWDFGDGTSDTGVNPSYEYHTAGIYIVTLTVTDDDGATDSDTLTVNVREPEIVEPSNEDPVADISFSGRFNFDGSGSYDPDGEIVSYEWDFGDGTSSNEVIISHIYDEAGTYTITLTVTDNEGATDSETIEITITSTVVDLRELDADKRPRILVGDGRADFEFGRIIPSVEKRFYSRGENIMLFVKIANEAGRDADLDFVLNVPEFNYQYNINNINVDSGQAKFVTVFLNIPEGAAPGNYVARLSLDSGEEIKRDYWQFVVA